MARSRSSGTRATTFPGSTRWDRRRALSSCSSTADSTPSWPTWPRSPARWARTCAPRSEEHTSELQSQSKIVCRLLLEKKKKKIGHCEHGTKKNRPRNEQEQTHDS